MCLEEEEKEIREVEKGGTGRGREGGVKKRGRKRRRGEDKLVIPVFVCLF